MSSYQTKELVEQHKLLAEKASDILLMIKSNNTDNALEILNNLNNFSDKLEDHLIIEDKILYPILKLRSELMNNICEKYIAEIGGLRDQVSLFIKKWNSESFIKENRNELANDAEMLFSTLLKRISKENNELFPLV